MNNWIRSYQFSAGQAGGIGFGANELRIQFSVEKSDVASPNTAKISLWNLNPTHKSALEEKDCVVTLNAGYRGNMPLVLTGTVTNVVTEDDGADQKTTIDVLDGRKELRDSYVTLGYLQSTDSKLILQDAAGQMGLPITFSPGASFKPLESYSYVGLAKNVLDKVCASNNLTWTIQNGVIQVTKSNEPISTIAHLISSQTGLIGSPKKLTQSEKNSGSAEENSSKNKAQAGWEIRYFLNAAIGVNDLVQLQSKAANGIFRVKSVKLQGDNMAGDWVCVAKIVEAE